VRKWNYICLMIAGFVFFSTKLLAFSNDSLKIVKPPKHYFNKTIYADFYSTGKRTLDTINKVSKKLNTYQVTQSLIGFNAPVFTKDYYNKDSTRISNLHLLLTGSYASIALNFGGISKHNLTKLSMGGRMLYNNGKKSIFFVEVSPFVTRDRGYLYTSTYRLATTVLYNCSVNPNFSFRLGFTRSFLWGNRFHLPYIGLRVGRLDKINFSVQFPRSITLNIPAGKYIRTSLFTKPQGGLYAFANTDSIQVGNINTNKKLYFGRSEFLSGIRIDVLPSNYINFYLSGGITSNNYISFFPSEKTTNNLTSYNHYYRENIKSSIFLNVGLVFRFGKTKSIYNSQQLYNGIDLNNSIDGGDNGVRPGNGNIPHPDKKIKHLSNDEVNDLIETQDIY
jgi:hypothetical protein